ncbi:hypothetical protein HMPREF1556_00234 [Porphyromonas sp. oral taxon 278 str. W7784]|nr:hypothetical protein HMPREF1556_00234 [Porphyromonas sp. oral taxon 278 str. W7784]
MLLQEAPLEDKKRHRSQAISDDLRAVSYSLVDPRLTTSRPRGREVALRVAS